MQASTKIQERYLEAIENNNLGILPGDFYVRAFIRQYALAVDLNPEDLLGEAGPASISRSKDLNRAHRDNDGVVRAGTDTTRSAKSQISSMLPTIWISIIVFLVLVGIWFVLTHLNTGSQQSNDGGNVSVSTSTIPDNTSSSKSSTSSSSSRKKRQKRPVSLKLSLGHLNKTLRNRRQFITYQNKMQSSIQSKLMHKIQGRTFKLQLMTMCY